MTTAVRPPLYFQPNPRPRWWGTNPDAAGVVSFLPTAAAVLPNLYDSAVPPKKLQVPLPHRMVGKQAPFHIPMLETYPRKLWSEHVFVNITSALPTVAPPTVNFFEGVPPPRKLPPHRPTAIRSQPLPSAPVSVNIFPPAPMPRKYPPHMPVRVQFNPFVIVPSSLAQLQPEFDPYPPPKKYPPEQVFPPAIVLEPVVTAAPPPGGLDYPSKVRLQWIEEAAYPNIAALPPLIALAQAEDDFSPTGLPKKQWAGDLPFPNVVIQPTIQAAGSRTIVVPWKAKQPWPEDAAAPNVPSLPTFVAPGFSYDYPSVVRRTWPIEPAPQDFWALPNLAIPPALYDYPALPAKRWPDPFPFTNWVQETPPPPPGITTQGFNFDWPKHLTLTWDDYQPQPGLVTPAIPIYIPEIGYEIYIPFRTFTVATPVRHFTLRILWRTFTVSRKTLQTFDVKDPSENWPLTFNMGPDLFAGETLTGPISVTVTLVQGADPNPPGILNGPAGFDPTQTQVVQPVTGGLAGCAYEIVVTCPTTNPQKVLTLVGVLPVQR